jgi:hypothetical protein
VVRQSQLILISQNGEMKSKTKVLTICCALLATGLSIFLSGIADRGADHAILSSLGALYSIYVVYACMYFNTVSIGPVRVQLGDDDGPKRLVFGLFGIALLALTLFGMW